MFEILFLFFLNVSLFFLCFYFILFYLIVLHDFEVDNGAPDIPVEQN